jgi:hypothetical protein
MNIYYKCADTVRVCVKARFVQGNNTEYLFYLKKNRWETSIAIPLNVLAVC